MTTIEAHPMLRSKRPIVITRPTERLAGDGKNTLEIGADALWVDGHGRFGKTFAFRLLSQLDAWRPYPLYMAEYTFTKPAKAGEREQQLDSDVALACHEYDEALIWPEGSGTTYTQFFAPNAYAKSWRLSTQLDLIRKVVDQVRSENGLGPVKEWPMLTFERFVYHVLVRIAFEDTEFSELTEAHIRDALLRSGYLHHEPGYRGTHA